MEGAKPPTLQRKEADPEVWVGLFFYALGNLQENSVGLEFPMPRGKSDRPTFKPYDQYQADLIPPTAIELVPENHLVRVVDEVLNQLDLSSLLARYDKGGGASRFHPTMLLKVWVYSYITKVYSGRQIAKQLRENLPMRWLAGAQTPDFRTLNTFRSSKLAPVIEEVFVSSVKLLEAKGYVQFKNYFVDGTKIEANANKYSFVWGNSVDTFNKKMDAQLRAFVKAAYDGPHCQHKLLPFLSFS